MTTPAPWLQTCSINTPARCGNSTDRPSKSHYVYLPWLQPGSATPRATHHKIFARTQLRERRHEAKAFIIHGFPGEDEDTTAETISLLTELGTSLSRVSLFRFVPLPGSGVYADPDRYDLHGLHTQDDWDGDWSAFHIHHNARHWWGTIDQWQRTERAYQQLHDFVETRWNPQG